MRVKICGITNSDDARAAADAGADAIGLNFVGGPRRIDPGAAEAILTVIPPFVTPVALVKLGPGGTFQDVEALLHEFHVSHLQVYGDWDLGTLRQFAARRLLMMPVVAVQDEQFAARSEQWGGAAGALAGVVLDTYDPQRAGGTGTAFRWEWIQRSRDERRLDSWPPIILAGGLRPENVAEAIRTAVPYAVDVSSGVEHGGRAGCKDPRRMRAFVRAARAAFAETDSA